MTLRGYYMLAARLHHRHLRLDARHNALIDTAERHARNVIDFPSQKRYQHAETRMLRAGLVAFNRGRAAVLARFAAYEEMMRDPNEEQERQKREMARAQFLRRNVQ